MVPLRPGNAGGGKDPDFWRAFDGGEDEVIGGEPANTRTDPDPPAKAVSQGEGGAGLPLLPALRQIHRADILSHAYALARSNGGAPGVDGVTGRPIASAPGAGSCRA